MSSIAMLVDITRYEATRSVLFARSFMTSNGEVEGPHDAAGRAQVERSSPVSARAAEHAPRAHTFFRRPRRTTTGVSRPPPTIVRRQAYQSRFAELQLAHTDSAPATGEPQRWHTPRS